VVDDVGIIGKVERERLRRRRKGENKSKEIMGN